MAKKGTTKYESNKQEKRVAQEMGGKTVMASGSLWFASSDVRADKFLVECKTTKKDLYILNFDTWVKIEKEAVKDGCRIPIMCIDLEDGKSRWAILDSLLYSMSDKEIHNSFDICSNSFRIKECADLRYEIVLPPNYARVNKRPRRLVIIPWEDFLEFAEKLEKESAGGE